MRVEAKTRSPTPFSAGVDSPVNACWSITAIPSLIKPSTGTTSPVLTTMTSPTCSLSICDLDLDSVVVQPDITRLLAEGIEQEPLGVVLGFLDQDAAETQAPAQDRAGKDLHGAQTADDHNGVEDVHAQPILDERGPRGQPGTWGSRSQRTGAPRPEAMAAPEIGPPPPEATRRAERQMKVGLVFIFRHLRCESADRGSRRAGPC